MYLYVKIKKTYYAFVIIFLICVCFYKFSLTSSKDEIISQRHFYFNHTVVHIDLKGAPPKLEYLTQVLRDLRKLGVTALLMEYEDMFPYTGNLEVLRAPNSYHEKELKNFLRVASDLNVEIIPLVQTFGHMNFVLETHFSHLKEMKEFDDSICPSRTDSILLIDEMIKQVVKFHNEIRPLKFLHIGCDEVYRINKCDSCKARHLDTWNIFVQHVKAVAKRVRVWTETARIIIWDDMMRKIDPQRLQNSKLQEYVEPAVWAYTENVLKILKHRTWYAYSETFEKIWVVSAFKGADGDSELMPNIEKRFKNHLSWMTFISTYKSPKSNKPLNIEGIFMTGWSRYTHTKPLCELLPVGMPSLILNYIVIKSYPGEITDIRQFKHNVISKWFEYLNCPIDEELKNAKNLDLNTTANLIKTCSFPHRGIYTVFESLNGLKGKNVSHITDKLEYSYMFRSIKKDLPKLLLKCYDTQTTRQIIKTVIKPFISKIRYKLKIPFVLD